MKKKLMKKLKAEGKTTKHELKSRLKSTNFWNKVFKTGLLIGFYYSTSIGLTFYQNWLLKELKFPLTIVLTHFIIKFVLATLVRISYSRYTGLERVVIGWGPLIGKVGVVALVASLDIGLSQWSFEFIDVALYTITKSTSIVFILMFAILLKLEKNHWSLVVIVIMISIGLIMFTYKSTDFVLTGFIMVLSASFLSGIRWTVSQLIMQKEKYGLNNPVDMIYHVQPLMIITLLPFTVGFEGTRVSSSVLMFRYEEYSVLLETIALITVGGSIAFLMEVGEFLLLAHTSSLTLSIAGIVKEVISLALAIVFQSNDISVINVIGLVVCMTGITLHVVRKATKDGRPEKEKIPGAPLRRAESCDMPLLSSSSESTDSETEIFHTSRMTSSKKSKVDQMEDVFMKNHREWTTVRDTHIENLQNPELATQSFILEDSVDNENCEVADDIVNLDRDESDEADALFEADVLLSQLDLLSSEGN
jgi:solute carrier family 35 protein C2